MTERYKNSLQLDNTGADNSFWQMAKTNGALADTGMLTFVLYVHCSMIGSREFASASQYTAIVFA